MEKLKNIEGITIIVLVITIIVLLILAGVSLYMLTGENGLITKAQESSFRTEMKGIKESVDTKKQANKILEKINNNEESILFTEQVTIDDAKRWDDYLLMEIIYWGQYEIDISSITREYAKNHWEEILSNKDNNGKIDNLYYIDKETANGKDHRYVYDTKVDIVYKIPLTTIGSHKVHSIEELDYQKGITKGRVGTLIDDECRMVEVDGISYYEPNLSGFILENTKLIYYTTDETSIEIPAKEYLEGGKQRIIEKDGKEYELYNYKNQKWANILIQNNDNSSYWVWIPRYTYKINLTDKETAVEFISLEDTPKEGYTLHSDFSDGKKGIWTSKYEPIQKTTQTADFSYYIPDMTGFDKESTYIEVYDSANNNFKETKLSDIDNLITFSRNNNWFNYEKQIWANIKVVNPSNNLETWWVWIPRYAYNITGNSTSIIFIDTNNNPLTGETLPSNYTVHPAFGDNQKGIWVSKYEPVNNVNVTQVSSNVNPPDLRGYNVDNTYIECYDENNNCFKEQTLRSILSNKSIIDEQTKVVSIVDIDYSKINGTWYSYDKKIWANIKIVNPSNNLETWWVWIPRYAYNITGTQTNIIYLNSDGNPINGGVLPSNYVPHPAFNESKEGIWASKYEPTEK